MILGAGAITVTAMWRSVVSPDGNRPRGLAPDGGSARVADLPSGTGALPVQGDTVRRGTLVLEVEATGRTEAFRRTVVEARTGGRIARLDARESRRVSRGHPLVRLDPGRHALAVQRAEAELDEARARYRELTLFDASIADPMVRRERAVAARARSGLARAEVSLRQARLDLDGTTLRAPFEGRVADVRATAGAWVAPGEEILTLVDVDPIRVEAYVVETELASIEAGARAEVRLPAFPDDSFVGRVVSINPVVDPESRSVRVTIEVANPDARIVPGMFARVALEGRAIEDVVTVPEGAVIERDGRSLVFVFEPVAEGSPTGRAKWVYVTTGRTEGTRVELVEGGATVPPEPGSVVLVDGHVTLVHDAIVRLKAGS